MAVASWLTSMIALCRRHWILVTLVVAAAVLRVVVALTYHPILMFYGDSFAYLTNAEHLAPAFYRPVLYSVFAWPFVHAHAIPLIPVAQHAMGLGIGVAVYAILYRLGAGPWSSLGAAPVLFDGYQLNVEQFALSETVFTALVVAAVALAVWRKRPGVVVSALAGAAVAGAALTRTVGLVLIVPLLVYLVARRARIVAVLAAAGVFSVSVFAYALWYQADRGNLALTGADGYFLYGRVATFADCTRLPPLPGDEWVLCDPRTPSARPSANSYIWSSHSALDELSVRGKVARNSVLEDFAVRVIAHQPLDYLRTAAGDVVHYFSPFRTTGRQDEPIEIWRFPLRVPVLQRIYGRVPPRFGVVQPLPSIRRYGAGGRFLRAYQSDVNAGPIMALALALGLIGLFAGAPGARRLRAECFLLVSSGLGILVVPAMTAMFDFRYMLPTLVLVPPAGVLGGLAVARRIASRRGRRDVALAEDAQTSEAQSASEMTPSAEPSQADEEHVTT
jgi:hypothetical protein